MPRDEKTSPHQAQRASTIPQSTCLDLPRVPSWASSPWPKAMLGPLYVCLCLQRLVYRANEELPFVPVSPLRHPTRSRWSTKSLHVEPFVTNSCFEAVPEARGANMAHPPTEGEFGCPQWEYSSDRSCSKASCVHRCCTYRMMVACANGRPCSTVISTGSRGLSLERRAHARRMISGRSVDREKLFHRHCHGTLSGSLTGPDQECGRK
jgi:hypothetical protein